MKVLRSSTHSSYLSRFPRLKLDSLIIFLCTILHFHTTAHSNLPWRNNLVWHLNKKREKIVAICLSIYVCAHSYKHLLHIMISCSHSGRGTFAVLSSKFTKLNANKCTAICTNTYYTSDSIY